MIPLHWPNVVPFLKAYIVRSQDNSEIFSALLLKGSLHASHVANFDVGFLSFIDYDAFKNYSDKTFLHNHHNILLLKSIIRIVIYNIVHVICLLVIWHVEAQLLY